MILALPMQEEDFHVNPHHLTLTTPPSKAFILEIVTEIYPQKNTSLEVIIARLVNKILTRNMLISLKRFYLLLAGSLQVFWKLLHSM